MVSFLYPRIFVEIKLKQRYEKPPPIIYARKEELEKYIRLKLKDSGLMEEEIEDVGAAINYDGTASLRSLKRWFIR